MNMKKIAEVFPPGEFLKEELDARGWSQIELAEVLDRPPRVVSEVISGKRAITPETAKGLGDALGTGAQFWMNLESTWQLSKVKVEENSVVRRANLYNKFPVKDMIKRGWIRATDNLDVLEKQFADFFQIPSINDEPTFPHVAKKTSYANVSIQQKAWLWRARHLATGVQVAKYSSASIQTVINELRACMEDVEEIRKVPRILANAGIRLVIVEALPGSKIDGVCFWLDKSSPVIALSLRFDKVDIFWHALMHEIDHIEHKEGMDEPIVDEELGMSGESQKPANEIRANDNAANNLIPRDEMTSFIARVNPLFSEQKVIGFAKRMGVHPGIVVGQLQHSGLLPWSALTKFKEKVRQSVVPVAMADGFGQIAQLNTNGRGER